MFSWDKRAFIDGYMSLLGCGETSIGCDGEPTDAMGKEEITQENEIVYGDDCTY